MRVPSHDAAMCGRSNFPSFSEGLSLRVPCSTRFFSRRAFPFLFGGTFIGGGIERIPARLASNFPSFSEGLSLRAHAVENPQRRYAPFPFLFGGTFIEGMGAKCGISRKKYFPSFSEGLSLRVRFAEHALTSQRRFPFLLGRAFIEAKPPTLRYKIPHLISLPSGKGFH